MHSVAAAFVGLFLVGAVWLLRSNQVSVTSDFPEGGAVRTDGVAGLAIELRIDPAGRREAARQKTTAGAVSSDQRRPWL